MAILKIGNIPTYGRVAAKQPGLESIRKDRFVFFAYGFCLISFLLQSGILLLSWNTLPPQVPVFYSRPWGERILSQQIFLSILPAITIISLLLNQVLRNFFSKSDLFLSRVLVSFSILVAFLCLFGLAKTVFLLI